MDLTDTLPHRYRRDLCRASRQSLPEQPKGIWMTTANPPSGIHGRYMNLRYGSRCSNGCQVSRTACRRQSFSQRSLSLGALSSASTGHKSVGPAALLLGEAVPQSRGQCGRCADLSRTGPPGD